MYSNTKSYLMQTITFESQIISFHRIHKVDCNYLQTTLQMLRDKLRLTFKTIVCDRLKNQNHFPVKHTVKNINSFANFAVYWIKFTCALQKYACKLQVNYDKRCSLDVITTFCCILPFSLLYTIVLLLIDVKTKTFKK